MAINFPEELQQFYQHPYWMFVARPAIFARDNWTCADCRKQILPGKGTKALHLTGDHLCYPMGTDLQDYIAQPLNQIETRCNKCHAKKTKADRLNRKQSA